MKLAHLLICSSWKQRVLLHEVKDANHLEVVLELVPYPPVFIICIYLCPTYPYVHVGVRRTFIFTVNALFTTNVHLTPLSIFTPSTLKCNFLADVTSHFPDPPPSSHFVTNVGPPPPGAWRHLWTAPRQGLICNSGRWWNCTAHFSIKKFAKRGGTVWKSVPPANWMRCRNGVSPGINSCTIMAKFSQARYQLFNCA